MFIHGNPLINMFRNSKRKLEEAGVKSGQKILEIGCGPGFYTIPAAGIVGTEGQVYAMDLQAGFIKKGRGKSL